MALEGINTAQYDAFVSFARANLAVRGGKSVARLAEGGAARAISAADPGRDGVHKFWRGGDEKTKNDQTRRVFRQAVADLFGGEDHIPENVRKAMKLEDYGQGKPLTAKRIRLVKIAVEAAMAFPGDGPRISAPAAHVRPSWPAKVQLLLAAPVTLGFFVLALLR